LRLIGFYPLPGSNWNGEEAVFYFDREVTAIPETSGMPEPVHFEPVELNGVTDWQIEGNALRVRFSDAELPRIFSRIDVTLAEGLRAKDGGSIPEKSRRLSIENHKPGDLAIAGIQRARDNTVQVEIWAPMACGKWEEQYTLTVQDSAGVNLDCASPQAAGSGKVILAVPKETVSWPVMAAFAPRETAEAFVKNLGTRGVTLLCPDESSGDASTQDHTEETASEETASEPPSDDEGETAPEQFQPEAFTISGGDYWRERGVEGASLFFYTDVPVNRKDLESRLTITPPVENLRIEYADDGFSLYADWVAGLKYDIRIGSGLRSADGKQTMAGSFQVITSEVPKVRGVVLESPARFYLPVNRLHPLKLTARNLEKVTAVLWRVFPSNLTDFTGALLGEDSGKWEAEQYAEEVARHDINFPPIPDRKVQAELDPGAILSEDRRGVYLMTFEGGDVYSWQAYPFVWTNIGMLAYHAGKDVTVIVHRLDSLEPVAGATVTLVSHKRQELAQAQTDSEGLARFALPDFRKGKPALVWVATDQDAAFLALRDNPSDETVRGIPQEALDLQMFSAENYDGFVYTDRNLYRPGETVHARFLVRQHYLEPAAGIALQARLTDPKGNIMRNWPVTLSALGSGGIDLETARTWLTGRYVLELQAPGSSQTVGSAAFNLESFVPNRIRASVETDKPFAGPGETVLIRGRAEQMYGGPAVGYSGEVRVILNPGKWEPAQWPGYRFSHGDYIKPVIKNLGRAVTDAEGSVQFSFAVAEAAGLEAPLEAIARIAVSEPGGRDVVARKSFTVLPAEPALGLLVEPLNDQRAARVKVAAVRSDGSSADLPDVSVALETERWNYHVRRMDNGYTIHAEPYYVTLETRQIPLSQGAGETDFSLKDLWGRYRIRVFSSATPLYATSVIFAGWNGISLAEDSRPSLVKVTTDKERYTPGETCELTIQAPFDGMAFVALEQDRILDSWRCPVQQGQGRLSIPVREAFFPNAWALVTVVRSTTDAPAAGVPIAVFGAANLRVTLPDRNLQITFPDAPPEIRPDQLLNLSVETRNATGEPVSAELTVAAVDQGIHDILGYDDPDPFRWFERPRKGVFGRSDYYDKVNTDAWLAEAVGGDALERRLGGVPAIGDNWIKPVALWSGIVQTGVDGKAVIPFQIPDYVGRLHIAAVASTGDKAGSAGTDIFVRKPYFMRLTVPRFIRQGDTFDAVVRLVNTAQRPSEVNLSWNAEGGLKGEGANTASVAAGSEQILRASFETVSREPGIIRWTAVFASAADGTKETVQEETVISVGLSGLWCSEVNLEELPPGKELTVDAGDFEADDDFKLTVTASASPLLPVMDRVSFLAAYPYGCTEQSISRAMPLITLADQLRELSTGTEQDALWDENRVREAMADVSRRIAASQLPSGGVAMWPGSVTENTLCTIYAAHFLALALENGLTTFDDQSWQAMRKRLWSIARGENFSERHSPDGGLFLRAYAAYVLSLQPEPGILDLAWQLEKAPLPESARMLLTAVVARLTGDAARAEVYRKAEAIVPVRKQEDGGALMSPRRETALALLAGCAIPLPLGELDGMAEAARYALTRAERLTTQESAFLCAALSAYHRVRGVHVGGKAAGVMTGPQGEELFEGTRTVTLSAKGKDARFLVRNTGATSLWIRCVREGMKKNQIQQQYEEGGLKISLNWFKPGRIPAPWEDGLVQGESYVGQIRIESGANRKNVAVSIPLPAGLEPVNPRLDPDALAAMGLGISVRPENNNPDAQENTPLTERNILTPSFNEIRDDRLILVFDELPKGKKWCYFLTRAVSTGRFVYPGVTAEGMYSPEARAGLPGGTVTIRLP